MKSYLHMFVLLLALMLSACASTQNHHDPIEPANRVADTVNDTIDRISLKPAAQGYTAVVPKPMRTAVSNFYDNATYMNTILNGFLQGKGAQGSQDFIRFLINTILGVGGLVDVASSMGFEQHQEDFGQTLAVWGVSQGAYIVYPLLGPNSLRNTPDIITATATDPLFWAGLALAPYITIPVTALKYIDKRSRLLDASDMRDELALDPYVFTREAWRQNREFLIHDGNPPSRTANADDDWEEDDFDSDDSFDAEDSFDANGNLDAEENTNKPETKTPIKPTTKNAIKDGALTFSPSISIANGPRAELQQQAETSPAKLNQAISTNRTSASKQTSYNIYLSSHYTEVEAAAEQGHFTKLGITTKMIAVSLDQHVWYRLQASQHSSKKQAQDQLIQLKSRTGLNKGWIIAE